MDWNEQHLYTRKDFKKQDQLFHFKGDQIKLRIWGLGEQGMINNVMVEKWWHWGMLLRSDKTDITRLGDDIHSLSLLLFNALTPKTTPPFTNPAWAWLAAQLRATVNASSYDRKQLFSSPFRNESQKCILSERCQMEAVESVTVLR